ncbi:protease inhibitor I42 family protein [Brevibacillus agri]|uniref:protease inhibitor I42 family protein n=1 Tax=Brevibacillus agri TaxID=51101 RepID=UPI001F47BD45|nr:protease inhibitor I42 family protein [Brevibacillus agri]
MKMAMISTYTLQVQSGQPSAVTLDANPTTGYQWALSNPLDETFLFLQSSEFVPPSQPARIGQGGQQRFTFRALRRGVTSLSFKYCRPWEPSDCASFVFYVVTVV